MSYITIVMAITIIILMAINIKLSYELKYKKYNLDSINESLKMAQYDLDNLAEQRRQVYLETQQLKENSCEIKKDIDFLNETAIKLRQNLEEQEKQNQQYSQKKKEEMDQELVSYNNKLNETLLRTQKDFVEQFKNENMKKIIAAQQLNEKLEILQSSVDSIVRINQEEKEKENYKEYHSLQLTEREIQDAKELDSLKHQLSSTANDAIRKVLWKICYERPYNDLVGRVLGNSKYCGIYKITNLSNSMCYIGQSVDIAERWRQHIKRAIGAEVSSTNIKLYNAMRGWDLRGWTWELIELCSRDKLNEREDYWQKFYHAKDYGYSIK